MNTLPSSNYLHRRLRPRNGGVQLPKITNPKEHQQRVTQELKALGVTKLGLATSESHYLPHIIHPDEHLGGVVYGRHHDGFVMLIATDRRIIFLDNKPLYVNQDEINYYVVSGVSYKKAGVASTVTLHTRVKEYAIQTFNQKCAEGFVEYIEARCLEHSGEEIDAETQEQGNDQLI
jgi:hypothetical protein